MQFWQVKNHFAEAFGIPEIASLVGCTIFENFAWKQNPVWYYAVE